MRDIFQSAVSEKMLRGGFPGYNHSLIPRFLLKETLMLSCGSALDN